MKTFNSIIIITASMFVFSCASTEPTTSDYLRGQAKITDNKSALQRSLAKDLEQGKKLIQSGSENKLNGQKLTQKGLNEITEGENLISRSREILKSQFPEMNLEKL